MKMEEYCDEERTIHWFFCKCGSQDHVLEVTVDQNIELAFYSYGKCCRGFWQRLKMAWGILRNKTTYSSAEFILRKEDRDEFYNLVKEKKQVKQYQCHSCDIPGCVSCGNPEYEETINEEDY